jgi:hypothetical protein
MIRISESLVLLPPPVRAQSYQLTHRVQLRALPRWTPTADRRMSLAVHGLPVGKRGDDALSLAARARQLGHSIWHQSGQSRARAHHENYRRSFFCRTARASAIQ